MAYFLGLLFALVAFWIGMSGHFEPLLLGLGAVSLGLTMILAYRLDILDREGVPYVRLVGFAMYFPWLMKEIIKANWTVIRACLRAELDIAPTLVKLKTTCTSDLAHAGHGHDRDRWRQAARARPLRTGFPAGSLYRDGPALGTCH